jgi:hypothetical protein
MSLLELQSNLPPKVVQAAVLVLALILTTVPVQATPITFNPLTSTATSWNKMAIWYKEGVIGTKTHRRIRWAIGRLAQMYSERRAEFMITSLEDGTHGLGSLHPDGKAVDFRKAVFTKSDIRREIGDIEFDIVEHSTHFHVEYDPK